MQALNLKVAKGHRSSPSSQLLLRHPEVLEHDNVEILGLDMDTRKIEELDRIINDENLDINETYRFMTNAFRDRYVHPFTDFTQSIIRDLILFTEPGKWFCPHQIIEYFAS